MMIAQQAPRLLAALNSSGGLENSPGIENALDSGYDIPLMENRFAQNRNRFGLENGLFATDVNYGNDIISKGFPSDFATQSDIQAIADGRRLGETPAEISAGVFLANPEQVPELPKNNVIPGTQIPVQEDVPSWSGSDMDDIHSSEMWQQGDYHPNPELKKWYKKNKR